ncbi:hypothetical protein ACU8KH_00565 [Lachancea thermotolerans]
MCAVAQYFMANSVALCYVLCFKICSLRKPTCDAFMLGKNGASATFERSFGRSHLTVSQVLDGSVRLVT